MTRLHRETVTCAYCGNEEEMTLFDLIDLEEDPDLKERILQKDLQRFDCSNCGRYFFVANPLVYLDPEQRLVISVVPLPGAGIDDEGVESLEDFPEDQAEELIRQMQDALPDLSEEAKTEGYRLRIVSSYNALIEKIHVFDDGLEDAVIEVLKLALMTRSHAEDEGKVQALFYLHTDADLLLFRSWDEAHEWDDLYIPAESYESAAELLEDHLDPEGSWQIVNRERAAEYLDVVQQALFSEEG